MTLTGGRVSGDVNLQLPEAFTAKLAALLLGRSVTSVTHESAADVTGELCNMLAGRVAATLAAAGYSSIFEHPDGTGDLFGRQNLPERLDLRGTFAQSRVAVNFKSR